MVTITFPDGGSSTNVPGGATLPVGAPPLPRRAAVQPLPSAPLAGLSQPSPLGPLPVIGASSR